MKGRLVGKLARQMVMISLHPIMSTPSSCNHIIKQWIDCFCMFAGFPIGDWFFPRASERRVLPIVGVCKTSSHPHIFTSSHLLILTSSHLHILSSSHLLILTIPTSSHPHIFTSSHPHIFTSSHLHICSSSHLLNLTSSRLHILTSSHLLIFTSSLLPSCSLALLLSPSFLFLSWRRGAVPTRRHETQPFRTKWGSIAKNWRKIASSLVPRNPVARNEVRSPNTGVKLRFASRPAQPFRTKWGSIAKNWRKIAICNSSCATLSHEMRFDRQKLT